MANFEKDASNADDFSEYEIPANLSFYESNEMKMNQNIGLRIFPITIEANPYPGYEFAGWSGDVVSSNLSITVDMSRGDVDIKANFVKCGEK